MKKRSRSKTALSREKILSRAVRLANRDGVDAVSMRTVAKALNVEAMSLYNHVKNKEDLLLGMVDRVVCEFELPKTNTHWKSAMRASVISTHEVLLANPWAAGLLISKVLTEDGMMRYSNACFGCLVEAGFSYAMADHAWNALNNHLYGFTLTAVNSPVDPADYAASAAEYEPLISEADYPYIRSMMRVIIDGEHSGVNDFTFGLDLILNGLEDKLG